MSNYTKSTNFATKDNLTPGDPLKVVRGTEIDTEYNNIATAIATKTDNASAAITGGTITGITDLAVADGGTGASTAAGALNNLLPSQTSAANKYLQSDGTNASWDAVTLSTADITGTLAVANGGTGVTTSTGTTNVVLSNSPTLVTPALGTPSAAVLTNATGLPISTGVSGLGTGVATLLATPSSANLASAITDETGSGSLVFATSPTLVTPVLGTPTSATLTNATGLPISTGVSGLGTGVATFLATPSSANLAAALTDETGSGANVFATSPTLVTPTLGVATATSLQGIIGNVTPAAGTFTTVTGSNDASLNGLTVGRGSGSVATNTAVGASALNNGSLSGGENLGLGYNSAQALTTGARNTILGSQSGQNLTTGSDNILIGYRTVYNATSTGSNNVAVGNQSLYSNTTASNNTAVGYQAGFSNTTSSANTSVGYQAGYSTTTSFGDVNAFGWRALYSNTTGYSNTAMGSEALRNNLTANNNTAIGYQAGYTNSTGSQNAFLGRIAGYYTTGGFNTFVGDAAGSNISSGTKNTIIGRYDGNIDSLDIRTLSNYVVLSDGDGNRQITMKEGQTLALDSAVPNAGTGITFPATQSASTDANTLDDYEEGTWTPAVLSGGVGITVSTASYTKIGRMVYLQFDVTIATNSNSSGFSLSGLPFVANSNRFSGLSIGYNTSGTAMAALVGGTNLEFYLATSATSASNSQASGARFIVGGCFQT